MNVPFLDPRSADTVLSIPIGPHLGGDEIASVIHTLQAFKGQQPCELRLSSRHTICKRGLPWMAEAESIFDELVIFIDEKRATAFVDWTPRVETIFKRRFTKIEWISFGNCAMILAGTSNVLSDLCIASKRVKIQAKAVMRVQ